MHDTYLRATILAVTLQGFLNDIRTRNRNRSIGFLRKLSVAIAKKKCIIKKKTIFLFLKVKDIIY